MEQSVGLFIERYWINPASAGALEEATSLTSLFLVVVGISATIAQGFLVRKWLKSTSEVVLFRYGLGVVTCAMLAIPALGLIGSFSLFLFTGAALALGSGMFNPSMLGLVSLASPEDKQGFGLAVNQSAAALGRILGPTSAGALFSLSPHAPFLVGAALAVVALLVSRGVRDERERC
jgi:MFS family permease